jgi:hypothetical protein
MIIFEGRFDVSGSKQMQYKDTRGLEWIPNEPGNRIATLMSPASKAKRERGKRASSRPVLSSPWVFESPWMHGQKERKKKNGSFSLIERVILSAGAMLIFSVSFQIDQMPEGEE